MQKVSYTKIGEVKENGEVIIKDGKQKIIETDAKKLYGIYHKFSNLQIKKIKNQKL